MSEKNNGSQLLIFASKRLGREVLAYLLETGTSVTRVIAAQANDHEIRRIAHQAGIPTETFSEHTLTRLARNEERFEWLLNLWSPHILPEDVLSIAKRRLNIHPGLLPRCRGNDCAAWTIRDDLQPGVSLTEMEPGVDTGAVFAEKAFTCDFPMRGKDLHEMLIDHSISLFRECWPDIAAGRMTAKPQQGEGRTYTRRETNADRVRMGDHSATLGDFIDWALAHDFAPNYTAEVLRDGRKYSLTLNMTPLRDD